MIRFPRIATLLLLGGALAGAGCPQTAIPKEHPVIDAASESAAVERAAHIALPAGATGLRYHQERGADPAIWLRLQLPAAVRSAFLRDAGYPDTLSSERRYVRNDQLPGESWWRPDEVAAFESGHLVRDQGRPRYGSNLLMSRGGGEITVYLMVTGL